MSIPLLCFLLLLRGPFLPCVPQIVSSAISFPVTHFVSLAAAATLFAASDDSWEVRAGRRCRVFHGFERGHGGRALRHGARASVCAGALGAHRCRRTAAGRMPDRVHFLLQLIPGHVECLEHAGESRHSDVDVVRDENMHRVLGTSAGPGASCEGCVVAASGGAAGTRCAARVVLVALFTRPSLPVSTILIPLSLLWLLLLRLSTCQKSGSRVPCVGALTPPGPATCCS